jgi:K+-sensing histidine kinase KdpD
MSRHPGRAYTWVMTRRAPVPDDLARAAGIAVAAFGPLLVAGLLIPFRSDLTSANVVLVFVLVVVLGAAIGTRWSGALTAVVAAMSYDFFFTKPYQSLKIANANDLETTVLLLAIGLVVAEIVAFTRRHRAKAATRGNEIQLLRRTAELVASGVSSDTVLSEVRRELVELLSLVECRYEAAPFWSTLPRIERTGAVEGKHRRWVGGEFTLPGFGAEIPVAARGRTFGRLVLVPDLSVGVSIEERIVAVALADQLGAALTTRGEIERNGR